MKRLKRETAKIQELQSDVEFQKRLYLKSQQELATAVAETISLQQKYQQLVERKETKPYQISISYDNGNQQTFQLPHF